MAERWEAWVSRYLPLRFGFYSPEVARWGSLIVGCVGMATSAASASFSVWQNAMRAILDQTEAQSNVMFQLGMAGVFVAFPPGMMYESWGTQATAVFGGVVSVLTFALLAMATGISSWQTLFSQNMWLIYIIWTINCFASSFTYTASLIPNIHNFQAHHSGKVIGLLDASLSLGPILLSVLYNTYFTNGYITPGEEDKQNLTDFFVLLAILYAINSLALVVFTGRLPKNLHPGVNIQRDASGDDVAIVEDSQGQEPSSQYAEVPFVERSFTKAIFCWNFYYFIAQLALIANVQVTYLGNITSYLRSYNIPEYNLLFTVLLNATSALSKLACGLVSDELTRRRIAPRPAVFLIPYTLQTLALTVSIFCGDNFYVFLFTTISIGICTGATWCLSPTVAAELFGAKYLASTWGWAVLLTGALGFAYSIGFSVIYQAAIYQPDEKYCYGLGCYTWSFMLFAGSSFCSLIMAIALTHSMLDNARDRKASQACNQQQQQRDSIMTSQKLADENEL